MTDEQIMETPEGCVGDAEQDANRLLDRFRTLVKDPATEPLVSGLFLHLVASNFEELAKRIDRSRNQQNATVYFDGKMNYVGEG